jgi:hypothetical protein
MRSAFKMNNFFGGGIEFVEVIFLGKVSLLSSGVEGLILWMMM